MSAWAWRNTHCRNAKESQTSAANYSWQRFLNLRRKSEEDPIDFDEFKQWFYHCSIEVAQEKQLAAHCADAELHAAVKEAEANHLADVESKAHRAWIAAHTSILSAGALAQIKKQHILALQEAEAAMAEAAKAAENAERARQGKLKASDAKHKANIAFSGFRRGIEQKP